MAVKDGDCIADHIITKLRARSLVATAPGSTPCHHLASRGARWQA